MDRPWWFKLLLAVVGLCGVVVLAIGFTPVHAGGSNEENYPSYNCGTIVRATVDPSVQDGWYRPSRDLSNQLGKPTAASQAPGCKSAMFAPAIAMVAFSLVGMAAAVALVIITIQRSNSRPTAPAATRCS
jgi:uncharacterized membrane protein YuzA (DUF378 family)